MTIMIDPPLGWQYGFPKPIPEERRKDALVFLVEQGYPQSLIDELGDSFYVRYFAQNEAVLKFNNGMLAILCTNCSKILKTGKDFNQEELDFAKGEGYIRPQYCEECKSLHKVV